MAERLKALVLKTSDVERHRGFESLSLRQMHMEKYPSGRRGSPAKGVVWVTAARVQIPASPRKKSPASEKMRDFSLHQNGGESFVGTASPLIFMRIGQLCRRGGGLPFLDNAIFCSFRRLLVDGMDLPPNDA